VSGGQLLDSHALLWFLAGDGKRIGPRLRERLEDDATTVSAASFWEIAIKVSLGKLRAPQELPGRVEELGFQLLPVRPEHAWRARDLPLHHRDPFDRLLIAQAQVERLPIVTADPEFAPYEVEIIWN
jgi:PIN domain nuclease of toxin-antitoxin system